MSFLCFFLSLRSGKSSGAKHDFRRPTLGVSARGPAKSLSLLFLKESSVLPAVFCYVG